MNHFTPRNTLNKIPDNKIQKSVENSFYNTFHVSSSSRHWCAGSKRPYEWRPPARLQYKRAACWPVLVAGETARCKLCSAFRWRVQQTSALLDVAKQHQLHD